MSRLKAAALLLSVWSGLNFAVAAAVTVMTLRGAAPALLLVFRPFELTAIDPRALAVVKAQAAIANPCICALCVLVVVIAWTSLVARRRWPVWALAGTLAPLQAFAFVSDAFLGQRNLIANLSSTALVAVSLILAAVGLGAREATGTDARAETRDRIADA
jgi:hypothetical protein